MLTLNSSIANLTRIGDRNQKTLAALGIETISDLIFYFPFRFDDFSVVLPIGELKQNMVATVTGRIEMIDNRRSAFRKKIITEAILTDDSGSVKVIWFNQPFLIKNLKVGECVNLSGRTNENFYDLQIVNPVYEKVVESKEQLHTGRLVPVYSLVHGLHEKQFRMSVKEALDQCLEYIREWLPSELLQTEKLLSIHEALIAIHFPKNLEDATRARERLSFDELFFLQVFGRTVRRELGAQRAIQLSFHEKETREWIAALPFALTTLQKKIAWHILSDIARTMPMNRLLEGDVGSGKTIVASLAILNAVLSKTQCGLMAPTEILARQHFETCTRVFSGVQMRIALLTSGSGMLSMRGVCEDSSRSAILEALQLGTIDLIIGTHAILEADVLFDNLSLVVVDEQHRFGVHQRQRLREKRRDGAFPHLLSLTATPIPRTLALTAYGDLDISILDELPVGRKKIITKVVPARYRDWTYEFIKKQVANGRQVFIICPRVDPSDTFGMKSVKEEYERLSKDVFSQLRLAMIHGKMKQKEKDSTMQQMLEGVIDILVASSVIEVGIDIPNATVMMIEGAERFGLAQLHQFRGRVGRATNQSYCFLLPTDATKEAAARLKIVVQCDNGFELAQKDLELRGPGELYGRMQSGLPALKIASFLDLPLVERAKKWAEKIEPRLAEEPLLQQQLERFRKDVHLE